MSVERYSAEDLYRDLYLGGERLTIKRVEEWLAAHDKEVLDKAAKRVKADLRELHPHAFLNNPTYYRIVVTAMSAAVRGDGER